MKTAWTLAINDRRLGKSGRLSASRPRSSDPSQYIALGGFMIARNELFAGLCGARKGAKIATSVISSRIASDTTAVRLRMNRLTKPLGGGRATAAAWMVVALMTVAPSDRSSHRTYQQAD